VDDKPGKDGRFKSRGRVIKTEASKVDGAQTPMSMSTAEVEDDGLGGYGFFDAGMLLQALKKDQPKPAEQIAQKRRTVGKKLALTEY